MVMLLYLRFLNSWEKKKGDFSCVSLTCYPKPTLEMRLEVKMAFTVEAQLHS